tara:strand:+ start:82 stop:450 length:369 start_codon:yes stop_codon:yes gene_type:complete
MKNLLGIFFSIILLSGCAETLAILGPASTSVGGGNVAQSIFSSTVSYGVKKQTGKSPMEHALSYAEKKNPDPSRSKCISFLKSINSELCKVIKKNIYKTKKEIFKSSKIEELAKKSDIYKRR